MELQTLYKKYGKASHLSGLSALKHFYEIVNKYHNTIDYKVFKRNILNLGETSKKKINANLIITDVPYGNLVNWSNQGGIDLLLDNLVCQLQEDSVVAIIHDKYQKRTNNNYKRIEKFKVGKRIIEILKLKTLMNEV